MTTNKPDAKSKFVVNVRCRECFNIFRSNELSEKHYNSFDSHVCGTCGSHGFYSVVEQWISESVWWKPWTWFRGYWRGRS